MPTIASMISEIEQRKKQEERISKQIASMQNLTNELSNNGLIMQDLSSYLREVASDFGGEAIISREDMEKHLKTVNHLVDNKHIVTPSQNEKIEQISEQEKETKVKQLEGQVLSLQRLISELYKSYEEASDNTGNLKGKISRAEYFGSVAHFRAWMDRFLAINGKSFTFEYNSHKLEYQIGYFSHAHTSTREVWNVYIDPRIVIDGKRPGDSMFGLILAVEDKPNHTVVEFIDGQCYERIAYQIRGTTSEPNFGEAHLATHKPIGKNFVNISELIKKELSKETGTSLSTKNSRINAKRGRKTPNLDTAEKIRKLLKIRNEAIKNNREIPAWSSSCNLAGIDHKTALRYLKELRPKWEDASYSSPNFGESGESGEF